MREINQAVPEAPVTDIARLVRIVQDNAASLGLLGGAFLLWAALSLFSVLESAFNIVYGKPNRPFVQGKGLALAIMIGSLVTLFIALVAGSLGVAALQEWAPWLLENAAVAYALSIAILDGVRPQRLRLLRAHERAALAARRFRAPQRRRQWCCCRRASRCCRYSATPS